MYLYIFCRVFIHRYGFNLLGEPFGYKEHIPISSGPADKFAENVYRDNLEWSIGRK